MWWEDSRLLTNRDGSLYIGSVSCQWLAQQHGTPLYIYDLCRVQENYARLRSALDDGLAFVKPAIYYAVKANPGLPILRSLQTFGAGIDASSPGELDAALGVGFEPGRALLTGSSLSLEDLQHALKLGVPVNVDSISQVRKIASLAEKATIMLRHNPNVGAGRSVSLVTAGYAGGHPSKFGMRRDELLEAARVAKQSGLDVAGIHQHIGSGWLRQAQLGRFFAAMDATLAVMAEVRSRYGLPLKVLDLGGGLGVRRRGADPEFPLLQYVQGIRSRLERNGEGVERLIVEPGAFLVEDAGILLVRVTAVDRKEGHWMVGVDAGLNVFNGPAYYGDYCELVPVQNPVASRSRRCTVVGNICEPRDVFASGRKLPVLKEGDVVAVLNAGAYGEVFSCHYNGRPIAGAVYVSDDRVVSVSPRRQFVAHELQEDCHARQ